ncbi:2,3-diphosphoglycerate-dependent phosphoglycerate mutase [Sulfuracidifex tepidarius]|uniref:2,3-bisphosphoglycerate-dependent phosphoglycerate mutase n=1 Tax=Sulfuracidifex tepidarius TaxID=1294262 RepID=A0A510DYM2_9CREN|nr:2,3-diphosphoglycerate-dependent phosphoglycerate mutase [Sulfuracidifex tepidarius]BBG25334.1 2,3-bisphosphoglycerate-dependent phosphoglycerate mutase [Sulfuracidifex tepidarius]BBG28128.1 2,3-bisphosphoglycerate-dependent phosphoglycerate mutase [Sulfuracidifex tepidarius]
MGLIIVMIRHGQSVSNVNRILSHDLNVYPLTDEGREQAKRAGREVARLSPKKIFTSPILRAYQTATIVGEVTGLIPIVDDRLKERYLGELNNKQFEPSEHWKLKLIRKEIEIKGIENWDLLRKRMMEFVSDLRKTEEGVIIAVSHSDPIRAVISDLLDMDDVSAWGIKIPNASLTTISCEDECKILTIGTPFLTQQALDKLKDKVQIAQ